MNDPILEALLDIKNDVGEVRAKIGALEVWLTQHVADDTVDHERIRKLEMADAVARGKASVWQLASVAAGSALGWAIEYFMKGRP
jgi:hypothetical protein